MTDTDTAMPPDKQIVIDRLAALMLTIPGWQRNYTATLDAAKWITEEAERVRWIVRVEGNR